MMRIFRHRMAVTVLSPFNHCLQCYSTSVVIVRLVIFSISYNFSVFAQNVLVLVLVLITVKIVSLVKVKINGLGISIS